MCTHGPVCMMCERDWERLSAHAFVALQWLAVPIGTPPEHHRNTIGTPSEHHRHQIHIYPIFIYRNCSQRRKYLSTSFSVDSCFIWITSCVHHAGHMTAGDPHQQRRSCQLESLGEMLRRPINQSMEREEGESRAPHTEHPHPRSGSLVYHLLV